LRLEGIGIVLTTAQKRYVDICITQKTTDKTNQELAKQFGVARSCIDRAIAWGREHGLYVPDTDKLRDHILELRAVLDKLEFALERHFRQPSRKRGNAKWKPYATGIASLSNQILAYRTRIMELEGLYRNTLNLQHTGGGGGPLRIQYEVVQPVPAPSAN